MAVASALAAVGSAVCEAAADSCSWVQCLAECHTFRRTDMRTVAVSCCAVLCCAAVLGAAQKDLLNDDKREELWKVLEMARGG
jgi:hypothetical protein